MCWRCTERRLLDGNNIVVARTAETFFWPYPIPCLFLVPDDHCPSQPLVTAHFSGVHLRQANVIGQSAGSKL